MLPEDGYLVRSLATTFRGGTTLDTHDHEWAQLVYASRGVMTVRSANGVWIVPAHRAVWVPPLTEHRIEMLGTVAMRTVYLAPSICIALPTQCQTIDVPPLLRELILEVVRLGMLHRDVPQQLRLMGVLVDRLTAIQAAPLLLPLPVHPRLRKMAEAMEQSPTKIVSLAQVAKAAHVSTRTVERVFLAETELSFGRWCQRMRLLNALRLLATGQAVTSVAYAIGYQSVSAFSATFKRELGVTPRHYFQRENAQATK